MWPPRTAVRQRSNGLHDFEMRNRQRMIAAIGLAIGAEDVRQFNAASCRCQPLTGGQHGLGHLRCGKQTGQISQEITGSATQESYVAGEKFRSFISSIIRSRKTPIKASLSEFDSRRLPLHSGRESKKRSMRK